MIDGERAIRTPMVLETILWIGILFFQFLKSKTFVSFCNNYDLART
jgi:hypothetical protein